MLKNKIYLKDFDYNYILRQALKRNSRNLKTYKTECIKKAIIINIKKNLNYCCKAGVISYGNIWIGRYSEDIPVYNNKEEVLEWEFLNEIMNTASQLKST